MPKTNGRQERPPSPTKAPHSTNKSPDPINHQEREREMQSPSTKKEAKQRRQDGGRESDETGQDRRPRPSRPVLGEVKEAIKAMKSGNAGGADGVTAEMLKEEKMATPRILTDIFRESEMEKGADS
ncbi:hypothetical protein ACROYT_G018599 [Oculina patagonica]